MNPEDIATARQILTAGIDWLYTTEQPATAVVLDFGIGYQTPLRAFQFCPRGTTVSKPADRPVIVVDVAHPERRWSEEREVFYTANPLGGADEIQTYLDIIADLGRLATADPISDGADSCVLVLDNPIEPTLAAAVERYKAGCRVHDSPNCSPENNGCSWYQDHARTVVFPDWSLPGRAG